MWWGVELFLLSFLFFSFFFFFKKQFVKIGKPRKLAPFENVWSWVCSSLRNSFPLFFPFILSLVLSLYSLPIFSPYILSLSLYSPFILSLYTAYYPLFSPYIFAFSFIASFSMKSHFLVPKIISSFLSRLSVLKCTENNEKWLFVHELHINVRKT